MAAIRTMLTAALIVGAIALNSLVVGTLAHARMVTSLDTAPGDTARIALGSSAATSGDALEVAWTTLERGCAPEQVQLVAEHALSFGIWTVAAVEYRCDDR